MTVYTHQMMINHHDYSFFNRVSQQIKVWRQRAQQRRELAHWTERDMHDIGVSWATLANEAGKPFWRE